MERLKVLKTYKMYIGGQFPRTESGRYFQVNDADGNPRANLCLASRKDFRNAVVVARKAADAWAGKTAYNRSQILYRIAEMLETSRAKFVEEIQFAGKSAEEANLEVDQSIDRWVYYAGWCDKLTQVFGSVNPVASSHFNFSTLEPMGVVGILSPADSSLLSITSALAPVLAAGNVAIAMVEKEVAPAAIDLAEVLNNSDVPGGVVNILTGDSNEILPHAGVHMDVNAIWYLQSDQDLLKKLEEDSVSNLKRIISTNMGIAGSDDSWESPYLMKQFTEVKTTWHPIEKIGGATSTY